MRQQKSVLAVISGGADAPRSSKYLEYEFDSI